MSNTPNSASQRILLVGEGRSPIHEAAWQQGLEAAGCSVRRFDWHSRFQSNSTLGSTLLRAQNFLLAGPVLQSLNDDLIAEVLADPPDVLLLYRPTHIFAETLRTIGSKAPSTLLVTYNNDDPFSTQANVRIWRHYLEGIPIVDVALAYREKNLSELRAAGARQVHLIRSYFQPDIHKPVVVTADEARKYEADIVFVGHYEPDGRLDYLAAVADAFPGFRLFGPDWDRAPIHPSLKRFQPICPLPLPEYVKAIRCAKIALVFLSALNNDTYTRRVFEIPAIGTFMLSQRTADMESLFQPDQEAAYFTSREELISQIHRYLGDIQAREKIAAAGAVKVREAGHDVNSRMGELTKLLRVWREKKNEGRLTEEGVGTMKIPETQELVVRATRFAKRVANFVRPRPRNIPLTVDQVLASSVGRELVERFTEFYYRSGTAPSMSYRGIEILKNPCDLWMAIELFQELKPTAVIETGTHQGGSAVYYGDMLKTLGISSNVITIDINPKWTVDPLIYGVTSVVGYSTDKVIVDKVRSIVNSRQVEQPGNVIVFLDSDHSRDNVLQELQLYSGMVTSGSYLIVEDTHVNGHPSFLAHGPGPWEAVDAFLSENQEFSADRGCERFLLTYNPRGWLRKK